MGKTSAAAKNRWNKKAYDQLRIVVPKGRKDDIEAFAASKGQSVNGYVNALIRESMGVSEDDWKRRETEEEGE